MTPPDRAGNTLNAARRIRLSETPKSFRDFVGGKDLDFYRFRVLRASQFSLNLSELTANADVALLDDQGKTLLQSARKGKRPEVIRDTLTAGTYFIRVVPNQANQRTNYKLTLSAAPLKTSDFKIEIDYRFDTRGWFTPLRRAVLEAAAEVWSTIIRSEFPDVPTGKRTPNVRNPATGGTVRTFVTDRPIDDLTIFVGARQLGGTTLALSGPSGYFVGESRYEGSVFQPWIGSMAFNLTTDWYFDRTLDSTSDVPRNQQDFFSTALHEIAHVLGFGTSRAFSRLMTSSGFGGSNTRAQNGGNALPLDSSEHIRNDYTFGGVGEPLMTPFAQRGQRKRATVLDIAVLNDLGHTVSYGNASVNPLSTQAAQFARQATRRRGAPVNRALGQRLLSYGRCGCSGCLVDAGAARGLA
ncbi:pre-peptidase C-terminal domain-containing protein [Thermoleptolyngbya sichuanensis XZ-Cy5]|uniref:pre-peptidase C-terminal domain-containing protein n=1 Tax=Thermoleptolyngbya sichuanensis TaxID=2885951 RepID=UPI00240CF523|nr:pre-peptidase C-terminal domain-containing protein [Thermoleptolyngbya sichuanensis]MDG2615556.1 pre-peptidase C-terminal domain-containing protein [Thermoleptolyngbya sichuanensis XZ-Cy5]